MNVNYKKKSHKLRLSAGVGIFGVFGVLGVVGVVLEL